MQGIGRRLLAAKGPRAFFFEVAIIVIGVLIALAAQEAVSEWNWSRKVAAGKEDLADENSGLFVYAAEQVTVAPCILSQVERVESHLRDRAKNGVPLPLVDRQFTFLDSPIRAPWRPMTTEMWASLVSDGTAMHLAPRWRATQSGLVGQVVHAAELGRDITQLVSGIGYLMAPLDLDQRARLEALRDLHLLRTKVQLLELVNSQIMARISYLRQQPAEERLASMINGYEGSTIAYCRSQALPMQDYRILVARELEDEEYRVPLDEKLS